MESLNDFLLSVKRQAGGKVAGWILNQAPISPGKNPSPSLDGLTVEQALGDMFKVKPPPDKPKRGGKKAASRDTNKQKG